MRTYLAALMTALLLLTSSASASPAVPELDAPEGLTVCLMEEEAPLSGGSLTLFQVGSVAQIDGRDAYVLTPDFADSGLSLSHIQSPQLAEALAAYAQQEALSGVTVPVAEGRVCWDLDAEEPGLFLVVQREACTGYRAILPFLVTFPQVVDASPKVQPPQPVPTPEPAPPPTPDDPTLPQTGQLNWPVPVLAASGLTVFALGLALRRREAGRRDG